MQKLLINGLARLVVKGFIFANPKATIGLKCKPGHTKLFNIAWYKIRCLKLEVLLSIHYITHFSRATFIQCKYSSTSSSVYVSESYKQLLEFLWNACTPTHNSTVRNTVCCIIICSTTLKCKILSAG